MSRPESHVPEGEVLELLERGVRDFAWAASEGAFEQAERALRVAVALSVLRPALAELVGEREA
jgi:hypothetical protein